MNEFNRDFKGIWIPKEIWFDENLNMLDKGIFMEIDSLDATEEGCYASNEYLAKFCQCTETKISTAIKKLTKLGYIEIIKFDGRKRFIKSRLSKNERQTLKNLKADFKNFKENNIDYNIISKNTNNIYIKHGEYKRIKLTEKEYQNLINEFGKDYIDKTIIELDKYVESNNNKNKYTNFNLVIRKAIKNNWFKIDKNPDWFGKKIKKEQLNDDEEKEIEQLMDRFN